MSVRITAESQLGPRVRPPFAVRFGVWIVFGILGAAAVVGSLISYQDRTLIPVQFKEALLLRSDSGGRIRLAVSDGISIGDHDIVARVEPVKAGVVVAVAHIPAPF